MPATREQKRTLARMIVKLGYAPIQGPRGILQLLGGVSGIIEMLSGRRSLPPGVTAKDLKAAQAVLKDAGMIDRVSVRPRLPIGETIRGVEDLGDDGEDGALPPAPQGIGPRVVGAFTGTENIFANEVQTPQSSNVFSFVYDETEGTLYVTFKGGGPLDASGKRPHTRGPMYAYGGKLRPVPPIVYRDMLMRQSKGKVVWDRLRVRGTVWGHQYPYRLVQGDFTREGKGRDEYVPRKVTRKGFVVRTVAPVGVGRRGGHVKSTLEPRRFRGQ